MTVLQESRGWGGVMRERWTVEVRGSEYRILRRRQGEPETVVCTLYRAPADAKLIAAAPMLWDELENAHRLLCGCQTLGENCGAPSISAALREVRG